MKRSFESEMMDDSSLDAGALRDAIKTIDRMNWLLGAFRPILTFIRDRLSSVSPPVVVADVGAGSGSLGNYLSRRIDEPLSYIPVEPSRDVLSVANSRDDHQTVRARCPGLPFPSDSVDFCVSSLVLHHVPDEAKQPFLCESLEVARHGVVHHDLLRNWFAYLGAIALTRLVSGSEVARNDGPLSVRRSLTVEEWRGVLSDGLSGRFSIERSWPWRMNLTAGFD